MSCNCTNTYDLGCFEQCDTVTFGTATQAGAHTLQYTPWPGRTLEGSLTIVLPSSIAVTDGGNDWQPGYTYDVRILQPDGTEFTRLIGGVTYDCFRFTLNTTTTL